MYKGRIGILGGTFDPVHIGHLITAQHVLEKRKLDKIIFIPCYISPHKQDYKSSEPKHRLEMLKLALSPITHFEYSEIEISNEKVSYTLETLLQLKKEYEKIDLIIGHDNFVKFDAWYKPDEIIKYADLLVMKRKTDLTTKFDHNFGEKAIFVETPIIEISSSGIRERIKLNKPIDYLVPAKVKEYIFRNHLYI